MKFKNDERFWLRFIGTNARALEEFCTQNNVRNVELIDRFPQNKTLDYYYETDMVYNLYGNNTPMLDYALSNKLYYAAKLKLPILVCPNTYMEEISVNFGFGYTFDVNDNSACDKLFKYYNSIDWGKLKINCDNFIKLVNIENSKFQEEVREIIYEN